MLKEIILKEEQETLETLYKYQETKKELEMLKEEKEKLEKELLDDEEMFKEPKLLPSVKQRKFNIFQKMFSKKYKEHVKKIEKYELELKEYEERRTQIEAKKQRIEELKKEIAEKESSIATVNVEELKQMALDFKDEKKSIEAILKSNPELAEDVECMKEAVEIDENFIQYDRTDDLQLYLKVLEKIKTNEERKKAYDKVLGGSGRNLEDFISEVEKELKEPKKVEADKYKIPTKYLYKAIRSDLEKNLRVYNEVFDYLECDGKYAKETGERIQQLYESEKNYLLIHGVFNGHSENEEENEKVVKKICLEGIRSSMQDEDCINNLSRTTFGNYEKGMNFLSCLELRDYNRIFMSIPKEIIDENKPVWGANISQIIYDTEDVAYILPQYVVGYLRGTDHEFVENPVPMEERRQYKYLFRQNERVSCNAEQVFGDSLGMDDSEVDDAR